MTSGRTKRTPEKMAEFLDALSHTASVTKSCELSGVARTSVYEWRADDEEFRQRWDAALELGTDALEDEAVRRALHGTDKPVYQGGELVGHIREYSDTLTIFMLKARRPEKFKERSAHEFTGKDGAALIPAINITVGAESPSAPQAGAGASDRGD
jgi:hypothetical protein